jgi:hypothetical protein
LHLISVFLCLYSLVSLIFLQNIENHISVDSGFSLILCHKDQQ